MNQEKIDIQKTVLGALTKEDIAHLIDGSAVSNTQMEAIQNLTEIYATEGKGALSERETGIANDIFKVLLTRAGVLVRAMLAMNLSQTDKLPVELAKQMASDVDEVATPILKYTEVLSDDDLLSVINSLVDSGKLQAIADREKVSEQLSDALVSTNIDPVVTTLVKNEGANISVQAFEKIARNQRENKDVIESIISRNSLSPAVIDKVIQHVSDSVRKDIEQKYGNLNALKDSKNALDQGLEITTLKMLGFESSDAAFLQIIKELNRNGTFLPVSALLMSHLELFEVSLSRILRIPLKNMRILTQDTEGFKTVYLKSKLPDILFGPVILAVQAIREVEAESAKKTGTKLLCTPAKMKERMLLLANDKNVEGLNHFFDMMQHVDSAN